jgi:hypothetical protein
MVQPANFIMCVEGDMEVSVPSSGYNESRTIKVLIASMT